MNYIIHSSALIALTYLIYRAFLSKETFYNLNRWVLLSMIVLSFTLPFISVPKSISFKNLIKTETITTDSTPVTSEQTIIKSTQQTKQNGVVYSTPPTLSTDTHIEPSVSFDWKTILIYIYVLGILVFAVHFFIQLGVLIYRMIKHPTIEVDEYKIIETDKKHAPYSFWNRIFMNPSQYNPEIYLQILKHEQVHIKGKHSFDMLLVECLVMFQWFNPFAWLYRKAIDNNLEYLTDDNMLTIGEDKEIYQMNLLKVSTPNMPTGLATSYNQSFLKKRIIMMNSKKSTAKSGWKYLIIIPLLALTVLSFNPISTSSITGITHEKEPIDLLLDSKKQLISTEIENDLTQGVWDAEVGGGKLCIMFRSAEPLKRNFWSITRCYDPSFFANFPSGDKQKLEITRDSGTLTFTGEFDGKIGDGRYTFTPNNDFITALKDYGLSVREKDLVHCFLTDFDRNYITYLKKENLDISQDDFEDIIHKSLPLDKLKMYRKELANLGYSNYTMKEIAKLNLFDADIPYIKFINKVNGSQTSLSQITKAKIHNLTPEFINSYNDNGYNSMSLSDYMKLKIHNVTPNFVDTFKKVGFPDITLKLAKELKIHNVTPDFINSIKKLGYPNITLYEAKKLKIHNITADFIKSFKKSGQNNLLLKDIIKLKIHNITAGQAESIKGYGESSSSHPGKSVQEIKQDPGDFIKAFEALGYKNVDIDQIISLKIHNVTPDFIKQFNNTGYKNIPLDDVITLKIHNVSPGFIESFKKAGYKNISIDDAKSLKIHNVSPDTVKEYMKLGYQNISIDNLVSLRIHNVTPEYIRNIKSDFGNLPLDEIISFKIHNVTPEFIKPFEALGYKNISADQARSLKIHGVTPEFIKSLQENDKDVSLNQAIRIKIHF